MKRFVILLLALSVCLFGMSCRSGDSGTEKSTETPAASDKVDDAEKKTEEAVADPKEAPPEEKAEPAGPAAGFDTPEAIATAFCDSMLQEDVDILLTAFHPEMLEAFKEDIAAESSGDVDPLDLIREIFSMGFANRTLDTCELVSIDDAHCNPQTIAMFEERGATLTECKKLTLRMVGSTEYEDYDHEDDETAGLIDGRWFLVM